MVTSPKSRWLRPLPRMLANPLYFAVAPGRSAGFKVAVRDMADIQQLADWAGGGVITPVLEHTWRLDEAAEALRVQGEFHARGKSVVVP